MTIRADSLTVELVAERASGTLDFRVARGGTGRELAVRVVRSVAGPFACMTCLTIDCVHARAAADFYAAQPDAASRRSVRADRGVTLTLEEVPNA